MNSQNITNELTHSSFALPAFKDEYKEFRDEFVTLLNNGLFYQSTGNAPGAAISYSMAETYLHIIKGKGGFAGPVDLLEQQLLGYIEVLTERTKNLVRSGGSAGKKDEKEDWESVCSDLKAETSDKTFADIIGMATAKQLVITSFIKPLLLPNLFPAMGKGVLLFGPPGTGKTYLAKGMISELSMTDPSVGVIFFAPTGADLKGKYVGETEKRITKYFTCAARAACSAMDASVKAGKPKKYVSVLFIDEFDSIAGDRSADETGLMANSVNTLLQMMDGVQSFKNVTVVAGTNYPWKLDAAILRRFNNQIYINVPQYEDIVELIKYTYKDSIAIKSSNVWCYCGGKQMESIYKAAKSMDALCGSELTTKDVKYNAALMRFEITLPSNVTFRQSAQKSITKRIEKDEDKPHYHINVCIVGKASRLFQFEFVLDGVEIDIGTEYVTAEMITDTAEEKAKFAASALKRPTRGGAKTAKAYVRKMRQTLKIGRETDSIIQDGGEGEPKTEYKLYINLKKEITETVDRETISKYFKVTKTQVKTKDIESRLPYKLFDLEFLRSPIIEEVAQLMFEKKYSNSDIANVMTYVAQQSGQKAAALGSYIRWSQPTPEGYNAKALCMDQTQVANNELSKYYISAMSVFKNKAFLDDINKHTVATLNLEPTINASKALLQAQKELAIVKATNPKADVLKAAKGEVRTALNASELAGKLYQRFYFDNLSKVYSAKITIEGKNYINCKFVAGIHLADMFIEDEKNDIYISEDLVLKTTAERPAFLKNNPKQIVFVRKRMEFTNRIDNVTMVNLEPNILLFELTQIIDNFTVSFLKDYNAATNDNSLGQAMSKEEMIAWISSTDPKTFLEANGTFKDFDAKYSTLIDRLYELGNMTSEKDNTEKAEAKAQPKKTHAITLIKKIMEIINSEMKEIKDSTNLTNFNKLLYPIAPTDEELNRPTQLFILQRMFQAEKDLLELGGISTQSTIVLPKETDEFTRTGDLYIGSVINLDAPWYKTVSRNNALFLNELSLKKTSEIIAYGVITSGAGSALAAYLGLVTVPAWLTVGAITTALGTVGTAFATGVGAVAAAAVASPFVAAGIAIASITAIATAAKLYKSSDRRSSALNVPPEATQAVEAYLKTQKITALQFLVGRAKYIAFQETDTSGLPIKDLEAFTLRTNTVGSSGVKSKKSSVFNFMETLNVISLMMTLRDLYSKDEYSVNPSFLAFNKVVKSNVFAIKGITKDDPFGIMLTKLYDDAENIMFQSGFQIDQYSLNPIGNSYVQKHQYTSAELDKSSLLNFHMSPGLLKQALNEFQSTYNGQLGGWLQQYESNRSKFIEDRVWIKK